MIRLSYRALHFVHTCTDYVGGQLRYRLTMTHTAQHCATSFDFRLIIAHSGLCNTGLILNVSLPVAVPLRSLLGIAPCFSPSVDALLLAKSVFFSECDKTIPSPQFLVSNARRRPRSTTSKYLLRWPIKHVCTLL